MKRKRILRETEGRRRRAVARLGDDPEERETLVRFVAPIVFGVGIGFIVLLSPGALIMAMGGVGDCFDAVCEQERQFWADLGPNQALLWLAAITGLGLLAHRRNHNLWLVVAVVSVSATAAGWITAEVGFGNMNPTLNGVAIPIISPAFFPWMPGSFFMAIGSVMLWFGARQDRQTGL